MCSGCAVHLLVSGEVQGVGFRYFTRRQALALALRGYVRNLPDGRVEVVAAGLPGQVQCLVEQVRQGPPGSRVRECLVEWLNAPGRFADFSIR
jgi:acylphosphatase